MSITFYPYRQGADGTWRCPLNSMDDLPDFANGNAGVVLDELGFGSERMWEADPVALDLFEQACSLAMAGFVAKPASESTEYMTRRIGELRGLAELGRAAGATHIGWG